MKHRQVSLLTSVVLLSVLASTAFGQALKGYSYVIPLRGNTPDQALRESVNSLTVPLWTYSVTATRDNNPYSGMIMGRKYGTPSADNTGITNIPTYVVPAIIKMPDGGVFDPTIPDPVCSPQGVPLTLVQNSPVFQSSPIVWGGTTIGNTQYIDALQRGEFWSYVQTPPLVQWHTDFKLHTTNTVTINVPAGFGQTYAAGQFGGCGNIGVMDINWLDNYVTGTLIPSLAGQGVGPKTFPVILFYNVVMAFGDNIHINCCILGYHGAYGSPMQVYSPTLFDTTGVFGPASQDISVLTHEMGEAVNDPTGNNATPAWGHIGQVSGCQNNFEVGDPLTGTQNPPIVLNGYTYHPQELAFFAWFFGQTPNPGVNGWYSTNDTFTTDAGIICH